MGTRNVADLQLWWSHPNYVPGILGRIRNVAAVPTVSAAGDTFRMDASYPDIDELTLGSGVGQMFTVKEYLGIGQDRKRRRQVNVKDVKEMSGSFVANFGTQDTPEQLFNAVNDDPGLGGNGVIRPVRLRVVFTPLPGLSANTDAITAEGASAVSQNVLTVEGAGAQNLVAGGYIRAGTTPVDYLILTITSGTIRVMTIAPDLAVAVADGDTIVGLDLALNLDNIDNANAGAGRRAEANISDFVIAEFDYDLTPDGEVMGNFSLQAAGTGFEYIR